MTKSNLEGRHKSKFYDLVIVHPKKKILFRHNIERIFISTLGDEFAKVRGQKLSKAIKKIIGVGKKMVVLSTSGIEGAYKVA